LLSCFESGDRIAVDYLTYPGIKAAAKRCGIKLVGIMMDHEGMIPNELETACKRHTIKGIYTSANLQNPTNATMSKNRRIELARVIEQFDLLLLEDDLLKFLCDNDLPALTSLLPERSIYISGIAKAFYAGLRTAFVVSPQRYYNRICQAIVDTVFMAPGINAETACECIRSGVAEKIIRLKREELSRRASIMVDMLKGYEYNYNPYSMFFLLKLPDEWNSVQFERAAQENGVNVIASDKFTVSNTTLPNYVRVSLSSAESISELERGLAKLLRVLRHEHNNVVHVI
jgi:DNA-binding transcriptional MocR family regulator